MDLLFKKIVFTIAVIIMVLIYFKILNKLFNEYEEEKKNKKVAGLEDTFIIALRPCLYCIGIGILIGLFILMLPKIF